MLRHRRRSDGHATSQKGGPFCAQKFAQSTECYRKERGSTGCLSLEEFVHESDNHLYHPISGLVRLAARAEVRIINASTLLSQLHAALETLELADEKRLRPSWDQYFMELASLAAQRSNCMKRRVGCVLVRENRVISTGYNGTPRNIRNCNAGGCSCSCSKTSLGS